jgi:hypothetical protein
VFGHQNWRCQVWLARIVGTSIPTKMPLNGNQQGWKHRLLTIHVYALTIHVYALTELLFLWVIVALDHQNGHCHGHLNVLVVVAFFSDIQMWHMSWGMDVTCHEELMKFLRAGFCMIYDYNYDWQAWIPSKLEMFYVRDSLVEEWWEYSLWFAVCTVYVMSC